MQYADVVGAPYIAKRADEPTLSAPAPYASHEYAYACLYVRPFYVWIVFIALILFPILFCLR